MLELQNLTFPPALEREINQGDPDKLFIAAMDFIDDYRGLEPEARMCWLYLFTDHHRGREFQVARLAKKICCPVAVTLKHLARLEKAGLVEFAHPLSVQ